MRVFRETADRLLNRLVPKARAGATAASGRYFFCYCDGVYGMYKECSITGDWCTGCVLVGHYCV